MRSGQLNKPFFHLGSPKFVDAIYALANPVMGKTKKVTVSEEEVRKYIQVHVRNYN